MKVLVVGSLNMDAVIEMEQMPLTGETILGKKLTFIPGGKGANQACAAGKLGEDTLMLGSVGMDEHGDTQKEVLQEAKVNVNSLKRSEEENTGMAFIYVDKDANNSIVVIQGANKTCSVDYLKQEDEKFKECEIILLQMEIPAESVYYTIKRGKELGKTIILNPAPAPEGLPDDIWPMIDYITPNETEVMKLSNTECETQEEIEKAAKELLKKGVKNVLVTLGGEGSMLVTSENTTVYPSRKVKAVDTTAAGDCFNGAFAVALSEGKSVGDAILFANAASSIAVTRKGAQTAIPDRSETECALNELRESLK